MELKVIKDGSDGKRGIVKFEFMHHSCMRRKAVSNEESIASSGASLPPMANRGLQTVDCEVNPYLGVPANGSSNTRWRHLTPPMADRQVWESAMPHSTCIGRTVIPPLSTPS